MGRFFPTTCDDCPGIEGLGGIGWLSVDFVGNGRNEEVSDD